MSDTPSRNGAAAAPQRKQKFELDAYTGHLFFRDEKKNEKCPDCDGVLKIGERTFEIAGWLRTSERSGKEYIFLKVGSERFD